VETIAKKYLLFTLKAVKFNKRARKPEELVATYVVELHALSQQYNFSETLELMLRNRIMRGINNTLAQKHFLAEKSQRFGGNSFIPRVMIGI